MAVRIARPLIEEMGITEEEIPRRKSFLEFDAEDTETFNSLNEIARRYADPVIDRR